MAAETRTGGREATTAIDPGRYALSVGLPARSSPVGWRWTPLTQIARLETGHTPSRKHPQYWGGEVPWIGIKDATHNDGRRIDDTLQTTTAEGIENSSARLLPRNTVCLSRTASVGYVVVMGREMATSQDFVNWVCDPEVLDWRFLKWVLLAEREALRRWSHGTTHQTIYFPEVKAFHLCLPSRREQQAIADVLGALDDKIESNRRLAESVRATARAMFDHVDGVEATVGDIVEFHNKRRRPLSAAERREMPGSVPYYGATCVFDHVREPIFDEVLLLVGEDGSVLRENGTPVTQYVWGPSWVNNHAHVLTGRRVSTELALLAIERADVTSWVTGAVQPKLSMRNLRQVTIRIPEEGLRRQLETDIDPLFALIRGLEEEAKILTALRDTLLPKLVSGQIRVPPSEDVEHHIGISIEALA